MLNERRKCRVVFLFSFRWRLKTETAIKLQHLSKRSQVQSPAAAKCPAAKFKKKKKKKMHLHTRFTFEYIDLKLKKSASLLLEKKVLFYIWLLHFFCVFAELWRICEWSRSEDQTAERHTHRNTTLYILMHRTAVQN